MEKLFHWAFKRNNNNETIQRGVLPQGRTPLFYAGKEEMSMKKELFNKEEFM